MLHKKGEDKALRYKVKYTEKKPRSYRKRLRAKRTQIERQCLLSPTCVTALPERFQRKNKGELEDVSLSFGFGFFYDPYCAEYARELVSVCQSKPKSIRFRSFFLAITRAYANLKETVVSKARDARAKKAARPKKPSLLPTLAGAICALLCVSAISLGVIAFNLLVKDRWAFYETVTVPELVGRKYPTEAISEELFEVVASYEYSSQVPEGEIIDQSPSPETQRRVYRKGEPCKITVTVSLGERLLTMKDYTALSLRDTLLDLKNESVKFRVTESYSDTVPSGRVISTFPSAGEDFSLQNEVSVTVSLGPKRIYTAIPDLRGLTEVRAAEVLRALGFAVGNISYVTSEQAVGTVVSQSCEPYTSLELGARVDMTVSAGIGYYGKKVPDLYGLTLEEAKARLADVGLVCGTVYSVSNGAGKNTVVAQSLPAGSQIPAGVASVDLYIGY